ncbi:hypothetical protein HOY80DRAFT_1053585 [Tuber brumale]|nr:hypothetical protein HOY80DRAFT_1053585 [Tuber brumale]
MDSRLKAEVIKSITGDVTEMCFGATVLGNSTPWTSPPDMLPPAGTHVLSRTLYLSLIWERAQKCDSTGGGLISIMLLFGSLPYAVSFFGIVEVVMILTNVEGWSVDGKDCTDLTPLISAMKYWLDNMLDDGMYTALAGCCRGVREVTVSKGEYRP